MTHPKYFGTDGIRGTAGAAPMSVEFVLRLGRAAGQVLVEEELSSLTFVVGRDSRQSGPMLQNALTAGLLSSGADVIDLGILPTPAIAYLTRQVGAVAGAVISASHNPAPENGIKFLNGQGMKLSEEMELAIESLLEADELDRQPAPPPFGKVIDGAYLHETYLQDLIHSQQDLDLSGLTVVMDCANGASYQVAPEAFRRLGACVVALNTSPNGTNINLSAGSEHVRSDPQAFGALVRQYQANLGVAFDGDADRVILLDEQGRLVDGDHMLAILAEHFLASDRLLGNTVVTTTMANGYLAKFTQERGIHLVETPVGDKYVTEELTRLALKPGETEKVGLGGEQSGHIILLDQEHRTGDGIRTALFMLQVLNSRRGKPLSDLTEKIQKYPQMVASCNVACKPDLNSMAPLNRLIDSLPKELPGLVRINLRYSGTEPKFRLMLETDTRHTPAEVARIAWQVCDLVQHETNTPAGARVEVLNVSDGGLMERPIK
ncbi:MAG: phosphoglucosamine mutase [Anaerolineaceae bacterium]